MILRSGGPASLTLWPLRDLLVELLRVAPRGFDAERPRVLPLLPGALGDSAVGLGLVVVQALPSEAALLGGVLHVGPS